MLAEHLGVKLNKKQVNTLKGEQMNPEFIKINPQHTIPTIVDDGFILWESRAIAGYLVEKYGKDDSLYPNDPQKRAVINQRLYFDMGSMYDSMAKYYFKVFFTGQDGTEEDYKRVENTIGFLNTFLEGHDYVAGDQLTIADFSILASVTNFECLGFDLSKYPNVVRWYANAKKVIPGFQENYEGAQLVAKHVADLKK
ncbi:hypothetical protein KR009_001654 [Drosophila setifemur]|nr:hypothetical protein KR009_001654 [Drosophila setifemur]